MVRRLLMFAAALVLAGCASTPIHFPSDTAKGYIGKPLFDLEMHWSTPSSVSMRRGTRRATWRFDQYNLSGCTVTVQTDASGVIRNVSWTQGCGPKGTGTPAPER